MSEGDRPRSGLSIASSTATISSVSMGTKPHSARPVRKVHTFGKRANSIKRDLNSPVIMRGWLYKQDSSGLKLWKRRWFVLSNYCLFYYRDSREEMVLGSILLPSYEIRTAFSKEKKNRRFVFKAEHPGMRTYYFSADTQLDMNSWIRGMKQSAAAECDCGNYNRGGLHSQSVSAHTSFEDIRLPEGDYAKSTESLEIAHISEAQEAQASSSESLHLHDNQKGSPCLKRTLSSSLNGTYCHESKEQPELSSLSSQTHGYPSPITCTKFHPPPQSLPPPSSESPPPSSPSRASQPSPLLSLRSSRAYSLPLTPAESPQMRQAHPPDAHAHQNPPRPAVAQAASCDDLAIITSPRTPLHANTPMGRVDIAPSKCLPNNPYAVASPVNKGRPLTPADRYDVFPTSEDSYGRRYTQSPHSNRVRPIGEDGLAPSVGRQQQNRFTDRGYLSPSVGPSRALVMSRLHGRLITPHSASSSYLHLPPLPPLTNRPTPGKRTPLAITGRNPLRERNNHSPGRQRFESDTDAVLTKLCGQDKLLRSLEDETGQLCIEKERLEKALEVTHLRLEEFKGQDATLEKICYQQRQLQDELVHVRARLCDLALIWAAKIQMTARHLVVVLIFCSTDSVRQIYPISFLPCHTVAQDSERVWEDYTALENDVQMLKGSLEHIRTSGHPQDQAAAQQDLWRIHDILAGLRCSPANCPTLENRRSGVSPGSPSSLDSHLGANHHPLLPCTETEESTSRPEKGKPGKTGGQLGGKQQDGPGSADWQQSPSTSSRGQLGASQHLDGLRGSPKHSSIEHPEPEKGKLGRGADSFRPDHEGCIHRSEDLEHSVIKVASSDATVPRRSRMSAQEQLDRMQRHQEAKRKSEAAQTSPLGHWRDSLRRGSSRPLPNAPPESSPKEGVPIGELKPPRCPPTPEWERQRVIQLSYALATEASQRGKLITGRSSSHSSLDDLLASQDGLNYHHCPGNGTSLKPDSSNITAEHDQTIAQNPSCSSNSEIANQVLASSQATNPALCASEASALSLPCPCKESWLSSNVKTPQPTSHLCDSTREEPVLFSCPHWEEPSPQPANWNSCVCRTANWVLPPLWDLEMWASDQKLVGSPSLHNGRCVNWRAEPHHVAAYFGEMAQPIKVTLIKSSF